MVKKGRNRSVLGNNPFGDINVVGGISIKGVRKGRKKDRKVSVPAAEGGGGLKDHRGDVSTAELLTETERKVDELLDTFSSRQAPGGFVSKELSDFASRLQSKMAAFQIETGREKEALVTLLKLLRPSFYLRKMAPIILAGRGIETNGFGMDPVLENNLRGVIRFFYEKYFRVEVKGLDNIPSSGGCIVVCNHAPALSLDGLIVKHAISTRLRQDVRWLIENELFYIPYIGSLLQRLGGVRASPENAGVLLKNGSVVITFPEGIQGVSTSFMDRYVLKRFGRGGYIKLAIKYGVCIVPTAIVGPQSSFPVLWKIRFGARRLSLPFIPVTPTFPLLGPVGLMPLPFKWRIRFDESVRLDYPVGARVDHAEINRINARIRGRIQNMIDEMVG